MVDTNVLLYPFDPTDRQKQRQARRVLAAARRQREQVLLSVQCLTEFYRAATNRLAMDRSLAARRVGNLARLYRVVDLTPAVVIEACRLASERNIAIWDALIWAVARQHDIPYILTEDDGHGPTIEGVEYVNPFRDDFDAARYGLELTA